MTGLLFFWSLPGFWLGKVHPTYMLLFWIPPCYYYFLPCPEITGGVGNQWVLKSQWDNPPAYTSVDREARTNQLIHLLIVNPQPSNVHQRIHLLIVKPDPTYIYTSVDRNPQPSNVHQLIHLLIVKPDPTYTSVDRKPTAHPTHLHTLCSAACQLFHLLIVNPEPDICWSSNPVPSNAHQLITSVDRKARTNL